MQKSLFLSFSYNSNIVHSAPPVHSDDGGHGDGPSGGDEVRGGLHLPGLPPGRQEAQQEAHQLHQSISSS